MPKVENCGEKKGRIVEEGGKNEEKKKEEGDLRPRLRI